MKLKIIASNAFKKDLKSAKKRGLKLDKLQSIVDKLADEIPLEQKGFYNKCWGDTTTVSLPTLFFCKKISI